MMTELKTGYKTGVRFYAEICSNHNGSFVRARKLIREAAAIGCTGVKFQLFQLDKLWHKDLLDHPDFQFVRDRKTWEMPRWWLPEIRTLCTEYGLEFGCTPFHLDAVDMLIDADVDYLKIASYEAHWPELVNTCLDTGKEVMVSTGLSTIAEVYDIPYWQAGKGVLLHCVSEYPTMPERAQLCFLSGLKLYADGIGYQTGYSDHTVNAGVVANAVFGYHARVVEFHLDLKDGQGGEYHLGHCWKPEAAKQMIDFIKAGEVAGAISDITLAKLDNPERAFMRDPEDGLRPLKATRGRLDNYGKST